MQAILANYRLTSGIGLGLGWDWVIQFHIGLLLLPLSVQGSFFSRIGALLGGLEWELESMLRELCSHFVGIKYKKLHLKQYPPSAAGAMLKFSWDKI